MSNNVRLQRLRDFTVQIRQAVTGPIVGTGIVVSMSGKVVTCAHVVRAAGVEPRLANEAEVYVHFPQLSIGEPKTFPAKVSSYLVHMFINMMT